MELDIQQVAGDNGPLPMDTEVDVTKKIEQPLYETESIEDIGEAIWTQLEEMKQDQVKEFQTQLGVKANGILDSKTRRAYASLYTEDNLSQILKAEGGVNTPEGELHRGAEIPSDLNPNLKQTTRYGVVIPHEVVKKNSKGKTYKEKVSGFAKLPNETDKQHAERYYEQKVLPKLEKVEGIENETTEVINALAKFIWNKGSLPKAFNLEDEKDTQEGMLDITTANGKQVNGVINRTLSEYHSIADIKGWSKITKIKTIKHPKNNTFKIQYWNESGLVHDDGDYKPKSTKANKNFVAGKEYPVSNNTIDVLNGKDIN